MNSSAPSLPCRSASSLLQLDVEVRVAADIARAAGACADIVQRLFHRLDHLGMLAHGEIVVGAPHRDRLGTVMAVEAARIGIRALVAQDVDEDAVAAFSVKAVDRLVEDLVVIHRRIMPLSAPPAAASYAGRHRQETVRLPPRSLRTTRRFRSVRACRIPCRSKAGARRLQSSSIAGRHSAAAARRRQSSAP